MMKRTLALLLIAFFTITTPLAPAFAADLVTVKAQGLVGEQPDGLLGIVNPSSAPADVSSLVANINAERMAKYEAIAAKNGTPVGQTQVLAGQSLINRTPSGQYVMAPDGSWMKK